MSILCLDVVLEICDYLININNYHIILTLSKEIYKSYKNRYFKCLSKHYTGKKYIYDTFYEDDLVLYKILRNGIIEVIAILDTDIYPLYGWITDPFKYEENFTSLELLFYKHMEKIEFFGVWVEYYVTHSGGISKNFEEINRKKNINELFKYTSSFIQKPYLIYTEKVEKDNKILIEKTKVKITKMIKDRWSNIILK